MDIKKDAGKLFTLFVIVFLATAAALSLGHLEAGKTSGTTVFRYFKKKA